MTTVGFGDAVPQETAGRMIAAVLMFGGLALFAVVTGAITAAFVAQAQAYGSATAKIQSSRSSMRWARSATRSRPSSAGSAAA